MTLLEALVALVILGASAAGFLGVFQNGARSVQSASAWNRASAAAEAALEESVRAAKEGTVPNLAPDAVAGVETRVDTRPWSGTVDDVIVRVSLPDGRAMTVHRLVRRQ
jgi:type II secretory pathway pseudopilin PulG